MRRARLEAQQMGSAEAQPAHVLLGCMQLGDGVASTAKKNASPTHPDMAALLHTDEVSTRMSL
jgi:hypothetical protein